MADIGKPQRKRNLPHPVKIPDHVPEPKKHPSTPKPSEVPVPT